MAAKKKDNGTGSKSQSASVNSSARGGRLKADKPVESRGGPLVGGNLAQMLKESNIRAAQGMGGNMLNNLMATQAQAPTVQNLLQYLQTQGYERDTARESLGDYLKQDLAYGRFAPEDYRAPTKSDLVGAVTSNAQSKEQQAQSGFLNDQILQFVEALRQSNANTADSYEIGMYDKVGKINDPARQSAAAAAVSNVANLMRQQANTQAINQFTPYGGMGGTSQANNWIPNILASFNSGQSQLANKLGQGTGVGQNNMGLDEFTQTLLENAGTGASDALFSAATFSS